MFSPSINPDSPLTLAFTHTTARTARPTRPIQHERPVPRNSTRGIRKRLDGLESRYLLATAFKRQLFLKKNLKIAYKVLCILVFHLQELQIVKKIM